MDSLSQAEGQRWVCTKNAEAIELRWADADQMFFRRSVTIGRGPLHIGIEELVENFIASNRRFLLDGRMDRALLDPSTAVVRIIDDCVLGDVIFVVRAIDGADASVLVTYEMHGPVTPQEVGYVGIMLARMPEQPSWRQLAGSITAVRPSPELMLPSIKQALTNAIDSGEKPSAAKKLLKRLSGNLENPNDAVRYIQTCYLMVLLLRTPSLADFLDSSTLDDVVAVFESSIFQFIGIGEPVTAVYLTSMFARALTCHPGAGAAAMHRSIRISQSLIMMTSQQKNARWRESLTSFLLGLARLSILDREIDPYKEVSFAKMQLDGRVDDAKRVLVNLVGSISMLTGTNRHRERLARLDIATHMTQALQGDETFGSQLLSSVKAHKKKRGDRRHGKHREGTIFSNRASAEFDPDEEKDAERWLDKVRLFDIWLLMRRIAISEQARIYGIEGREEKTVRTKIGAFVKKNSPRHERDRLLFIRGFRASRRIWIPNSFEFTSTDVIPFHIEPTDLLLEAALNKGLGVLFECYAIGGLYEMFGMGRWDLPFVKDPDTQWQKFLETHVNDIHSSPRVILVLPDVSSALTWEIHQLIDWGHLSKMVIIMMPEALDQTASSSWGVVAGIFRERGLSIEKYSAAGGFVALDASGQTRKRYPFESLYSGGLARELYKQAAGSRRTRVRSR